jgi:uncharacterized Zn-binding protein involved in type VI secretion
MKLAALILVSACGFSPSNAIGVDADHPMIDAPKVQIDAHVNPPLDAFVFEDAPAVEAFDPANCPIGYSNNTVTASPSSRYRIVGQPAVFGTQQTICAGDHPGWTHLVVLDTQLEATQIETALAGNAYYVGAIQPPNQQSPDVGWLQFTGEAVPADMWQINQPNDNGDVENNEQNFVAADNSTGLLNDVSGTYSYLAVCECDGKPIAPAVITALGQ